MNEEYMKITNELALENKVNHFKDGGPFGAIIVMDGKIVGRGKNSVLINNDPTAHAEVCAIRDASKNLGTHDLSGAILYTSTYPCPMCLSATIWANIKTIYYGNTKEDAADIGFRDSQIYDFINGIDKTLLQTININRDITLEAFHDYKSDEESVLY